MSAVASKAEVKSGDWHVYGELLGMTKREIADLAAEGVF
jgi:hypothetical protein